MRNAFSCTFPRILKKGLANNISAIRSANHLIEQRQLEFSHLFTKTYTLKTEQADWVNCYCL